MAYLLQHPTISTLYTTQKHSNSHKLSNYTKNPSFNRTFYRKFIIHFPIFCSNLPSFESYPLTDNKFLTKTSDIFETLTSTKPDDPPTNQTSPPVQPRYLKWPMWLMGPTLLLATSMGPTLWLPLSSVFIGPNIASLLSLIGLDCIFNIGAYLFLLMADACARPKTPTESFRSKKIPFNYRFWNLFAIVTGFFVPSAMMFLSHKGLFGPQLTPISYAVLLGPYFLLLSIQMITEMLMWRWESPAWLVGPLIYEAYRVLQLMRGINLAAEINAPVWVLHMIKGLVCWWVLILCVQLMRVAWYTGFTARDLQVAASSD